MRVKTFLNYIRNPQIINPHFPGLPKSALIIFSSVLYYYLFVILGSLLLIPLYLNDLLPERPHFGNCTILTCAFIVPAVEELTFRLPLRNFYKNIFISLGVVLWVFTRKLLGIYLASGMALLVIGIPYYLSSYKNIELRTNAFFERHFKYFFYASVLLFGFLHLDNFQNLSAKHFLVSPLLVSFQLVMGLIFGYLRMNLRFGIIYSFFAHALINLPLALLHTI